MQADPWVGLDGVFGQAHEEGAIVIIAEDLLLLLMDDETGKPVTDSTRLDHALAGAVLLELALAGKVDAVTGEGWVASARKRRTFSASSVRPCAMGCWSN